MPKLPIKYVIRIKRDFEKKLLNFWNFIINIESKNIKYPIFKKG